MTMLYNYVIPDKSRIFLLHEGMHMLLLPESSCVYEFTTCKQVAKCKKIADGYTKNILKSILAFFRIMVYANF